ncbi:hypothetical protein NP493_19g13056 [Ridgeia piscesae]|uniref:Protein YIPF n=1 Tax=Ridgeia piscesae TaxID=27915 RepID=A0AAD9PEC1_RIDPI|nr:hypothetical protein NP493_19g13056 [Ridgeia piscesae]
MMDLPLEGDITVPGAPPESEDQLSTLDEPIRETVMRDLRAVGRKFFHVLYPKQSRTLLRDWDLWGPLVLCVFLGMMLQGSETKPGSNDGGPQFAQVFVIYWVGAAIVTLNIKLLGGSISFFQSICVLGYCVLPLILALIVCRVILVADTQTTFLFIIRCIAVLAGFGWAIFASTAFLTESQPERRKALALYPIVFFYFVISWLIISSTH